MSTLPLFLRYLPKGKVTSPTCSCTERLNSLTKLIGGSQLNQKFSFSFSKAHRLENTNKPQVAGCNGEMWGDGDGLLLPPQMEP